VLRDESRKAERISKRAFSAEGRQRQKAHVDLNWQAMYIEHLIAFAHAAAVDAGIAESVRSKSLRRQGVASKRMARLSMDPSGPWTPAAPRALAAAEGRS